MFMDSCTGHCILKQRLEKKLQVILLHSLLHATWIAGVQQLQRGSHVCFLSFGTISIPELIYGQPNICSVMIVAQV